MSQGNEKAASQPVAVPGGSSVDGEQPKTAPEELVPLERYALVPTNPAVVAISKTFGWNPKTTIARIERALPEKFEQQVYLSVAESFRIHPESLAELLTIYRGSRPLSVGDLERHPVGENLVSSRFAGFADFFEGCMNLVKIVCGEYGAFNMSMELAGLIVLIYGSDSPELVIEMIDANLEECCGFFGINTRRPYSERMRVCVWLFITKLLPELRKRGIPDVLNFSEFLEDRDLRRLFRGAGGEEFEDLASDTSVREQLRGLLGGGLL